MKEKVRHCPGCRRESCNGCGLLQQLHTNKKVAVAFPERFRPQKGEGFGISFDMGTTTLAGMLWDLEQAVCLNAVAKTNPQAAWGSDVVSRIRFAVRGEEELLIMQKTLVQTLDKMAEEMAQAVIWAKDENEGEGIEQGSAGPSQAAGLVRTVTVVGNTAMCQFLLGIMPQGIAKAPFCPDYEGVARRKGRELGFSFLKDAQICVLPPIGGYVGADALAVYVCLRQETPDKNMLAVDIGTNGEILLQSPRGRYVCSAAAGPALEGGGAACGMRAVKGAVDRVSVGGRFPMQDLVCHVLGEEEPKGICGSGLLDALACLLQWKVIDEKGYLRTGKEAANAGAPGRICNRIEEGKKGNRLLLTSKECPVYLTGEDIRQLQLSIGAIRAGAEVLLQKAGLTARELDRVYQAGAFGSHIGADSSLATGLLPPVFKERVYQAGNLAGTGAAMALLSEEVLQNTEKWAKELSHVALAEDPGFEKLFLQYMNLGED